MNTISNLLVNFEYQIEIEIRRLKVRGKSKEADLNLSNCDLSVLTILIGFVFFDSKQNTFATALVFFSSTPLQADFQGLSEAERKHNSSKKVNNTTYYYFNQSYKYLVFTDPCKTVLEINQLMFSAKKLFSL